MLPIYAQGSSTHRVAVRNAVIQDEWRSLVANRATETLEQLSDGVQLARESQRVVRNAAQDTAKDVKMSKDLAQEVRDTADEQRDIQRAHRVDEDAEGEEEDDDDDRRVDTRRGDSFVWYHDAFDL